MQSHFFGSIVATKASEVEDDLLIIDGQQRITTLSLLILAAFNAVANGDMQPGNEDIEEVSCWNGFYTHISVSFNRSNIFINLPLKRCCRQRY